MLRPQLPSYISEKLLKISSSQEIFNTAKVNKEMHALKKSGYNVGL